MSAESSPLTKQLERVRLGQRGHDDALAVALRLGRLCPHVHLSVHRQRSGGWWQGRRVHPRKRRLLRIVLRLKEGNGFLLPSWYILICRLHISNISNLSSVPILSHDHTNSYMLYYVFSFELNLIHNIKLEVCDITSYVSKRTHMLVCFGRLVHLCDFSCSNFPPKRTNPQNSYLPVGTFCNRPRVGEYRRYSIGDTIRYSTFE